MRLLSPLSFGFFNTRLSSLNLMSRVFMTYFEHLWDGIFKSLHVLQTFEDFKISASARDSMRQTLNNFFQLLQWISFPIRSRSFEIFKEKYSYHFSTICTYFRDIWQHSSVYTAFLLSMSVSSSRISQV